MAYMPIFRRIWPERPGVSTNWYDDWHSWPLDETALETVSLLRDEDCGNAELNF
ncbi:predicted protein [Chaetomium globosum CBS 148.51]|uniref:Uncharacterized protein n=1 Tax=Chaetomium globosum (strain ATCC 6205 / CBS 148.51 / DSM 1962 / NBRC 6347 / NRRL 1970) TaxID=306901 RepID=Q2GT71_CHAGB|nr:uncharacterized protein CHGG_08833 [Chaetomium globosum CBS 148.51]EAQ84819.1 predicted protein [Chaetomium globosum CBS 148.51]